MNCQDVQGQLSEYVDLSLSASQLALIEEHFVACSDCREEAELLAESVRQVSSLPLLDTPLGFTQRVMSHVGEADLQLGFWQKFLLPLSGKMPVPALALVIVSVLGIYLVQKEPPQQHFASAPATPSPVEQESTPAPAGTLMQAEDSVVTHSKLAPTEKRSVPPARSVLEPGLPQKNTDKSEVPSAAPRVDAIPPASSAAPTTTEPSFKPTPVVSGNQNSGSTPFPKPEADVPPVFRFPTLEPFADLELILRRHVNVPADMGGAGIKREAGQTPLRPI
jgi:hypothetical protein